MDFRFDINFEKLDLKITYNSINNQTEKLSNIKQQFKCQHEYVTDKNI